SKATPEARFTRLKAVSRSRQDVSSVADIARPRVNDADEIMFGLEQSIAVTATNCYVQRRLARCQEHQLGWGWINHNRLGEYGWRRRRQWLSKKSKSLSKKYKSNHPSALNLTYQTGDQWAPDAGGAEQRKESSHEKVLVQARGDPYRAHPFVQGRMIQPYDLLTALDLNNLVLFFWFTLLFDLPRYILSAIALACVPGHSPPPKRC